MASEAITVRTFETVDYDMVCEWWRRHRTVPVPFDLLPAFGVIAHRGSDDLMAGWVYFDTTTPVCFASHLVARHGLPLTVATMASEAIFKNARKFAFWAGYRFMMMYAPKGIARIAERNLGFVADKRELTNLAAVFIEEEMICQ